MDKKSIEKIIRNVISREILIDGETISSNTSLLTLPVDQDDWSCLLIPSLIEEFDLSVELSDWNEVETISEIADLVSKNVTK